MILFRMLYDAKLPQLLLIHIDDGNANDRNDSLVASLGDADSTIVFKYYHNHSVAPRLVDKTKAGSVYSSSIPVHTTEPCNSTDNETT